MRIPPYFGWTLFRDFGNALLDDGLWEHKILRYLCLWRFQATDEDGSGMDDQSLRDELMTLLVAVHILLHLFSCLKTQSHQITNQLLNLAHSNLSDVDEKAKFLLRMGHWLCKRHDLRPRKPCALMLVICWQGHTMFHEFNKINWNWQGQETSAILLTWALLMLACNPHTQEILLQEVNEVLGGLQPTHSDVPKLRLACLLCTWQDCN